MVLSSVCLLIVLVLIQSQFQKRRLQNGEFIGTVKVQVAMFERTFTRDNSCVLRDNSCVLRDNNISKFEIRNSEVFTPFFEKTQNFEFGQLQIRTDFFFRN